MLYFTLKYLHVIGACVLLGTGAGIAFFMLLAHRSGDVGVIAGVTRIVVIADFLFTATAVVAQPVTGLALASVSGYHLGEGWIVLSILLYLFTGAFWLPVVWMQLRMGALADNKIALAAGLGFKLLIGPAVLAIAYVEMMREQPQVMRVIVFESAMAPQIGASIVAIQHRLNPPLVTLMVGLGTLLSFVTLPLWWLLLGSE